MKYNFIGTKEKLDYFKSGWKSAQPRKKITKVIGHDFAGGETLTAKSGAKLISDRMNSNPDSANVNWIVDAKEVYAIIPESQSAYATGVSSYNQCSLSIEIAPSFTKGTEKNFSSEKNKQNYYKAWLNMCKLMADIIIKYDLTIDDIMQHNQIKSTACPYTMKIYFGSYAKALSETKKQVKKEIDFLKEAPKVDKEKTYLKELHQASGKYNVMMEIIDGDCMVYADGQAKKPIGKHLKEITSTNYLAVRKSSTIFIDGKYWLMCRFMGISGKEYFVCFRREV